VEAIQLAAILVSAALLASMVSVQVGISVALIELALGKGRCRLPPPRRASARALGAPDRRAAGRLI